MRASPLVVLALAGCVGAVPEPEVSGGPVVPILLDGGGIEPMGTGLRIDYGRDGPGVIDTVSRLQGAGPARQLTSAECGAPGITAAQWSDGLILVFRNGAFAGWRSPDATRSGTGALANGAACAT